MASRFLLAILVILLLGCQFKTVPKTVTDNYAKESERLTRLGNEAIDSGDLEAGEKYLKLLEGRGYIGAWELRARLHTANEEYEDALKVLDKAIGIAPDDWVLRLQRGNTLSDLERWTESAESYAKARDLEGVKSDVDFNEGLMLLRQKKYAESLPLFQAVLAEGKDATYRDRAATYCAICLVALGRDKDIAAALKPLSEEAKSEAWAQVAIHYLSARDNTRAKETALHAARLHRTNDNALWCVREIDNRVSSNAFHWSLQVTGSRDGQPFVTGYQVLAESPEQGLEFARRLEAPNIKLEAIEEKTKGDPDNENPMGVYRRIGFLFYEPD